MKATYAGKITSAGSQVVEKLFGKPSTKGPKVHTGSDLRAKPSKK